MKSVCFIVSSINHMGGVQKVNTILVNRLVNKFNIYVISFSEGNGIKPFFKLDDRIITLDLGKEGSFRKDFFKISKKIRDINNVYSFDYIVYSGMGWGTIVNYALREHQTTIIGWEHQNYYYGKPFGLEKMGKWTAIVKNNVIVVLTKEDYKAYKRHKCKKEYLHHIYNPNTYRGAEKYNCDSKTIVSCGRLSKQKGFDKLIRIASLIVNDAKGWTWEIWGSGELEKTLKKQIKENKVESFVKLMGTTSNMEEVYSRTSFLVMTSRHEGFPMTLIEAKASNIPIISFDCRTGPSELIQDGVNGYLIKDFDESEMADKVKILMRDQKTRLAFSKNSHCGLSNLSIDKFVDKWSYILEK